MIAVTFALPNESRDFRRLLRDSQVRIALLHTGVGQKVCRERIEPFLDRQRYDFLISSGFAGGVDPSLGVGDLLLAENFSDPNLLGRAQALLTSVGRDSVEPGATSFPIRAARLATVERIVESAAERAALAQKETAVAVDMETRWIAQACARRNIPLLSLRVISDTGAAPFPAPPGVLFDLVRQETDYLKLTGYLARNPSSVVRLIRFGRQIRAASENLAHALEILLRAATRDGSNREISSPQDRS